MNRRNYDSQKRTSKGAGGFTLTQLLVSCTIMIVVLGGILSAHVFGLKMSQISQTRLGGTADSRKAITTLSDEVRAARNVQVGNGSLTMFTNFGVDQAQSGNAVQIYPSTATNVYVRYVWHSASTSLLRLTNGTTNATVIVTGLGSNTVFIAEDFAGNVLSNRQNNFVLHVTLQFTQLKYPNVSFGPSNLYDYYYVNTRIACRTAQ
jgi:hypothetical protein